MRNSASVSLYFDWIETLWKKHQTNIWCKYCTFFRYHSTMMMKYFESVPCVTFWMCIFLHIRCKRVFLQEFFINRTDTEIFNISRNYIWVVQNCATRIPSVLFYLTAVHGLEYAFCLLFLKSAKHFLQARNSRYFYFFKKGFKIYKDLMNSFAIFGEISIFKWIQ